MRLLEEVASRCQKKTQLALGHSHNTHRRRQPASLFFGNSRTYHSALVDGGLWHITENRFAFVDYIFFFRRSSLLAFFFLLLPGISI